jgi:hypothetical protein
MSNTHRKQETRNKIMMGGLIVKAKLDYLHDNHKDVLLGILLDAFNKLNSSEGEYHLKYFKQLGENEFKK